jgi:pre-mRNA-splicing factor ATP-dependent RNA helicase DHX15/PRP43
MEPSSSLKRKVKVDLGGGAATTSNKKSKSTDDVNPFTGRAYSANYYSILQKRTTLPVYQFKEQLLEKVADNQCVVVEGESKFILQKCCFCVQSFFRVAVDMFDLT